MVLWVAESTLSLREIRKILSHYNNPPPNLNQPFRVLYCGEIPENVLQAKRDTEG